MIHPATELYAAHVNPALVRLLGTFGYGRVFQRAQGSEVFDAEGRRYLEWNASTAFASKGVPVCPWRITVVARHHVCL